jgi:hypothetical protein
MPAYTVETKLSTDEAIAAAVRYFGESGVGLDLVSRDACCARFEGGGGFVSVTAETGKKTTVDLETREWDFPVKRFMQSIG